MNLSEGLEAFRLFYLREGYSPWSAQSQLKSLRHLVRFLEPRGIERWEDLTAEVASAYQGEIRFNRPHTYSARLRGLRAMGKFLLGQGLILHDPAEGLKPISVDRFTALEPLSHDEVARLLAACDLTSRVGMRDHALLSLMWEACLTFADACGLGLDDLAADFSELTVHGRLLSRSVALSESRGSLARYLEDARGHLVRFRPDEAALFVLLSGKPFSADQRSCTWIWIMGPYLKQAGIAKKVAAHALKWARVKYLLDEGVPIEEVRALAAHKNKRGFEAFVKRIRG